MTQIQLRADKWKNTGARYGGRSVPGAAMLSPSTLPSQHISALTNLEVL